MTSEKTKPDGSKENPFYFNIDKTSVFGIGLAYSIDNAFYNNLPEVYKTEDKKGLSRTSHYKMLIDDTPYRMELATRFVDKGSVKGDRYQEKVIFKIKINSKKDDKLSHFSDVVLPSLIKLILNNSDLKEQKTSDNASIPIGVYRYRQEEKEAENSFEINSTVSLNGLSFEKLSHFIKNKVRFAVINSDDDRLFSSLIGRIEKDLKTKSADGNGGITFGGFGGGGRY